jgi:hypothetical protein
MALSAFDGKSRPPSPAELKKVLGKSAGLWDQLISHITESSPPITEQWNFSGAKFGWSLRLRRKDRIVLYMTPQAGVFLVGIVLGEKAAKAAHESSLPDSVLTLIDGAPRYAEGRGIRLAVATRRDLLAVKQLAALKMAR